MKALALLLLALTCYTTIEAGPRPRQRKQPLAAWSPREAAEASKLGNVRRPAIDSDEPSEVWKHTHARRQAKADRLRQQLRENLAQ